MIQELKMVAKVAEKAMEAGSKAKEVGDKIADANGIQSTPERNAIPGEIKGLTKELKKMMESQLAILPDEVCSNEMINSLPDEIPMREDDGQQKDFARLENDNGFAIESKAKANEEKHETDDTGNIFKTEGKLNADVKYIKNGVSYETDSLGRISSWENNEPRYNPDAERDLEAQGDAGGEDRLDGDDGGHLVARTLNGSSGLENIIPMRDTINRGDYKKTENEIIESVKNGRKVYDSGKVFYDNDSNRPYKFERKYIIDDITKEATFDNIKGSQELLKEVKDNISSMDYRNCIRNRILEMEEDGAEVSITSVIKEYNAEGKLINVTVGIRDETMKTKTYITINGR